MGGEARLVCGSNPPDPRHDAWSSPAALRMSCFLPLNPLLTDRLGEYIGVAVLATTIILGIAFGIGTSNPFSINDCVAHTSNVDNATWKVYATGDRCDTAAQLGTIDQAIKAYMRELDSEVCGGTCMRMDHEGRWNGFVTVAEKGEEVDGYYCGTLYNFGDCGSGGRSE